MKKILSLRHRKKAHARPKSIGNPGIWFSAPSPPWIDLPTDVTANILHRLGAVEILESAQKVCGTWWRVCKDPSMWRVIHLIDPDEKEREISRYLFNLTHYRSNSGDEDLSKISGTMCCRAVDRSQGGLIDISIGYVCTDNLLRYISDRSSHLKRLTINAVVIPGLTATLKKWGELEELRLFFTPFITAQDIETIGICCPMLNTFAFNNSSHRSRARKVDDGRALAIGKNMPNLRHLELYMNSFSEKGLQAILDGCPCLESLDLRRTGIWQLGKLHIWLGNSHLEAGDLQNRCSWIKDLRLPSECTWLDDYESDDEDEEYDRQKDDYYILVSDDLYGEGKMNCRTGTLVFDSRKE